MEADVTIADLHEAERGRGCGGFALDDVGQGRGDDPVADDAEDDARPGPGHAYQEALAVDAVMLVVVHNVLAHGNPPFCPLFLDDNRAVHEKVDAAVVVGERAGVLEDPRELLPPFCAVMRLAPVGEGTRGGDGDMVSGARSAGPTLPSGA